MNESKLTLNRLDQTYFRGYNFNANQFIRKDTLFSIGGEGFWQKHSIITFYNHKTLEWDIYESKNKNSHPTNFLFSGYSKKHDAFFSAYLESDSVLANKDVFLSIYSFKNKKWDIKGSLNEELVKFAKKKYKSVWTGEYLILYNDLGPDNVMLVEPFSNVVYKYNTPEDHFFMANCDIYYQNGNLFSRSIVSSGKSDKQVLDSISIQKIIKDSIIKGKAYESDNLYRNIVLLILFTLLIIIILIIYFKTHSKLNGKFKFSELEIAVVKEILGNPINKKFTTIEINTLLEINDKFYDNQRQIRNRVIGGINKKLFSFFDNQDFIIRMSNADDKRMMDYYLNPEIKKKNLENLSKNIFDLH